MFHNVEALRNQPAKLMKRLIDIENLLIWAFADELAKGGARAFDPWDRLLRAGMLGVLDDASFFRLPAYFGDPHPDALTVARVVAKLPHRAGDLVLICAWKRTRPEPFCGTIRVLPVHKGTHPLVVGKSYGWSHRGLRRGEKPYRVYPDGAHCPLRYDPTLAEIAESRTEWCLWWCALDWLAARLGSSLRDFTVRGIDAPKFPWITPPKPKRVLHSV